MNYGRRFGGTALGMGLTVLGWSMLSVTTFGPRLLVALVGFAIGHGVVYVLAGPPRDTTTVTIEKSEKSRGGNAFLIVAVLAGIVGIVAVLARFVTDRQVATARREAVIASEETHASLPTDAAVAAPTASAASFSGFSELVAGIGADPEKAAREPRITQPDGTVMASCELAGCTLATIAWQPKNKESWGVTAVCPALQPSDLAPPGGIDALDANHIVITAGPLAGVFADRNFIDPTIWTIATVARRMTYDASMFVFCAEKRVPGRSFLPSADFLDRCETRIQQKMGRTYCTFTPVEAQSGYDCGRTWETSASCGKELFDENKITRAFKCVYDAKTAVITLTP